eukprot:TRINITY_DN11323_c0_g1_i1.p1 TRINITY_DN11323_c0_g1~~TRINITY_DN11323_c0_g1_i1.p1  ORF type:complete len:283 (+),score=54.69 TRINITY_DN11323_c0_g1_i1:31-879(+)
MDAALLAEREAFKRRAMAVPTVENKKKKVEKEEKKSSSSASKPPKSTSYSKFGVGGSQFKFNVLAKIVRHMKVRHMEGEDHPLSLDEILDETNQLDVSSATKQWLLMEALGNNPKIEVVEGQGYIYKPPFKIRNKNGLVKLLKKRDLNGEGGVMYDEVIESLPKAEKIIQNLTGDGKIIQLCRPDKKKVLFYYDHSADIEIDGEFVKQWRSVSVDGLDIQKIEDYLDKQGIRSMQDQGIKKVAMPKRKKGPVNRKKRAPKDNDHLADVLEDYSEMTANKADR